MPKFEYEAIAAGDTRKGVIEALDEYSAMQTLRQQGVMVIDLKQASALKQEIKLPNPPNLKDYALACKKWGLGVRTGMSTLQILDLLRKTATNPTLSKAFGNVLSEVQNEGLSISESMERQKVFPNLMTSMVRLGETAMANKMANIMDNLNTHYSKEFKIRSMVQRAMVYPIIVTVLAIAVTFYLMTTVVPQLGAILVGLGGDLPFITTATLAASSFIKVFWWVIVIGLVGSVYGLYSYYKTPEGRNQLDPIWLKTPIMGKMLKQQILSRITRTMGMMISNGLSITDTLSATADGASNTVYTKALNQIGQDISQGYGGLELGMSNYPELFPPDILSNIQAGEQTGKLAEMLPAVSDYYDEEAETTAMSLADSITPLLMVMLGLVIGFILGSVFMPMFSIINQLSQ